LFATAAVIASIILLKEKPGRVALGVVALVVSMGIFIRLRYSISIMRKSL